MLMAEKKRVLFVCVENACRSQIAEGFARHYAGDRVEAYSAGSHPRGSVDPTAIVVMQEKGIDVSGQASKGLDALPPLIWDAIVTMGCGDACPHLPTHRRLDWQIPVPVAQLEGYRNIRDQIEQSVKTLLEQLVGPSAPRPA